MQFTVDVPDEIAQQLFPAGRDPARTALEDMAVEAYRARRLTEYQLATLLGMERYELDGFLKQREVWLDLTNEELGREIAVGQELLTKRSQNDH
jgi:predicted HTH domain antitoxin